MRQAFEMPATIDAVDPTVVSLKAMAADYLSCAALMGFEVAMSEALANIVTHAFKGLGTGFVTVELEVGPKMVRVIIVDDGNPAPSDLYETAPRLETVDTMAETGRGLSLIGHFAKNVSYHSEGVGNRLTLDFSRGGQS